MNHPSLKLQAVGIGLACATALLSPLRAEQSGDFTYRLIHGGTEVEITDYPSDATGEVAVPASIDGKPVTSIGNSAFSSCSKISGVTLPASITNIGKWAFGFCGSLTEIAIPAGVATIGDGAFYGCGKLTAISVDAANPSYTSIDGVLFNAPPTELIVCPGAKSGAYAIPAGVTSINNDAFYGCRALTDIIIPEGVASIGGWAFYDCDGLSSVHLPASVASIGTAAFLACSTLESISVDAGNPNFASAEGVLFNKDQTELVAYPTNKAGPYEIPPSVATIRAHSFSYCRRITGTLAIPEGVTAIEDYTFRGCSGLSGFALPSTLTSIGMDAFKFCSGLISIRIPANVANIGIDAFRDDDSLKSAVFLGNAPTLGDRCFQSAAAGFTVYYLKGKSGFSTPTWEGYPTVEIDEAIHPAATWLLAHGLAYDTPLDQDLNGDGVDLLMAYALDLAPNQNLAGSVTPPPVLGPGTLSITFHAGSPGVVYIAETSTDMVSWTTAGVALSGPPEARTATVARDSSRRFLRLRVTE